MLALPAHVLEASFRMFRQCGQGRCECVLYWLGRTGSSGLVDALEHPAHRRSFGEYEIDSRWLTAFWFWLAREERQVLAQVHTHPGAAFHSPTDDAHPIVHQPGFISIVIPNFGKGPIGLANAWVGQLNADGRWLHLTHSQLLRIHP